MGDKVLGVSLDDATTPKGGPGAYSAVLSPAWEIWGPSGGYLAALALRASGLSAELDQPASFYCQFLRPPSFGLVDLDVSLLKPSRRSEALVVQLTQQNKPILHALVRTATDAPGYEHEQTNAPDVPSPEALKSTDELWTDEERPPFAFWDNLERRPIDQQFRPASSTAEPDSPSVREWVRFRPAACFDDPFVDAARSLILLDTYGWPAAFRIHRDGTYLAPSLDTSAWFHQLGRGSEWLLIDHECPVGKRGLLGVSGRVWDINRRLVATGGAQLCCIPPPAS